MTGGHLQEIALSEETPRPDMLAVNRLPEGAAPSAHLDATEETDPPLEGQQKLYFLLRKRVCQDMSGNSGGCPYDTSPSRFR